MQHRLRSQSVAQVSARVIFLWVFSSPKARFKVHDVSYERGQDDYVVSSGEIASVNLQSVVGLPGPGIDQREIPACFAKLDTWAMLVRTGTERMLPKFRQAASYCVSWAFVLCSSVATTAFGEDWGSVKGKFVYKAEVVDRRIDGFHRDKLCGTVDRDVSLVVGDRGGLRNVFIGEASAAITTHPSYQENQFHEVVLRIRQCQFEPRVSFVWRERQELVLLSGKKQPTAHFVRYESEESVDVLRPVADPVLPIARVLNTDTARSEPYVLGCNVHPWERAYVFVSNHPYCAVTDDDGRFEIKLLPAGRELQLRVWHERFEDVRDAGGRLANGRLAVTLQADETRDLGEIELLMSAD